MEGTPFPAVQFPHAPSYHFDVVGFAQSLHFTLKDSVVGYVMRLRQNGNAFVAAEDRPALQARSPAAASFQEILPLLWSSYDAAVEHEELWRRRLVRLAKQEEVIERFEALPGISWIRAATLYAYLDTPWRFRGKAALWKYLGIGLERKHSGNAPEFLPDEWAGDQGAPAEVFDRGQGCFGTQSFPCLRRV